MTQCSVAVGGRCFQRTILPSSSSHPEDVRSKVLRNVGSLPQHYTASQRRRPRLESDFVFSVLEMYATLTAELVPSFSLASISFAILQLLTHVFHQKLPSFAITPISLIVFGTKLLGEFCAVTTLLCISFRNDMRDQIFLKDLLLYTFPAICGALQNRYSVSKSVYIGLAVTFSGITFISSLIKVYKSVELLLGRHTHTHTQHETLRVVQTAPLETIEII